LNLAARHGHSDIVSLLLEAGAEPDHADADGWTALRLGYILLHFMYLLASSVNDEIITQIICSVRILGIIIKVYESSNF
jgi:hypothetical protein